MPEHNNLLAHYNAFYADHDHRKPPGFEAAVVGVLSAYLPWQARLLDAGCGTGAFVAAFTTQGHRATGFDLSITAIRRAQEKHPRSAFIVADALHPPFPPASFDAVFCSALSLFNVADLQDALPAARTLAALIRPGGLFIYLGGSALRPDRVPSPTWYSHTLPQFRAFLAGVGQPLLLRATAYRLVAWLGPLAFSPPFTAAGRAWVRLSGRRGPVLGAARVV